MLKVSFSCGSMRHFNALSTPDRSLDSYQLHPRAETQTPAEPTSPLPFMTNQYLSTTIGLMSLLGILLLVGRAIAQFKRHQSENLRPIPVPHPDIPCQRCQYFNHSAFLHCAVNPTVAMTQSAADCSDFTPQQSRET